MPNLGEMEILRRVTIVKFFFSFDWKRGIELGLLGIDRNVVTQSRTLCATVLLER